MSEKIVLEFETNIDGYEYNDYVLVNGEKYYKKKEEKPKMINWYRPKLVWVSGTRTPSKFSGDIYHPEKNPDAFLYSETSMKILEWETIEAPESWDQCK